MELYVHAAHCRLHPKKCFWIAQVFCVRVRVRAQVLCTNGLQGMLLYLKCCNVRLSPLIRISRQNVQKQQKEELIPDATINLNRIAYDIFVRFLLIIDAILLVNEALQYNLLFINIYIKTNVNNFRISKTPPFF